MEVWKVKYDPNNKTDEVYAISLIGDDENPANMLEVVTLSDGETVEVKFAADNVAERMVYAIVLRADQMIPRKKKNADGSVRQIFMTFDAEAIRGYSQEFLSNGYQLNSSWNHDYNNWLKGLSVTEQWIVRDPNNDTANAVGLKVEKDDWVVGIKLSQELWDEYVKPDENGKSRLKGVSIDAFLSFNKVSMKNETVNDNTQLKKIKTKQMGVIKNFIKLFSNVKFASISVDGVDLIADSFDIDSIVSVMDENEELVPVGAKVFEYEGYEIETDADGKIIRKDLITDPAEETGTDSSTEASNADAAPVVAKKEKQTLSGEVGAFIELPVGEWTIGETVYTVEEVTIPAEESYDGQEYKMNAIVGMTPVGGKSTDAAPADSAPADSTTSQDTAMKVEMAAIKEQLEKLTKLSSEVLKENENLKSLPTAVKMKANNTAVSQEPLTSRERLAMAFKK